MLVTKQDQLLSRDHRKSGNWSSRTFGAKREGVARETEQLELKLEEPETDQARPDIQTARHSDIAGEAIERIAAVYAIESEVRGKPPDQRSELRQSRSRPLIEELHDWLHKALATGSRRRRQRRCALSAWAGRAPLRRIG
jgi:Transposase IS66 family